MALGDPRPQHHRVRQRGHTCDLHRQAQLINHYTARHRTPTVIWDKDRTLRAESVWRRTAHTRVQRGRACANPRAHSLLFPVAEDLPRPGRCPRPWRRGPGISRSATWAISTTATSPSTASSPRQPPASSTWSPGNGPRPAAGRAVRFAGRIPFEDAAGVYGRSLATVLMLPERYAAVGQMTQRIFEAVLAGCLPLRPGGHPLRRPVRPEGTGRALRDDVLERLSYLSEIAGTEQHAALSAACVDRLRLFGLCKQVNTLESVLHGLLQTTVTERGAA
ncbi:hypothetical protein LV779_02995 [Streptomyces thinghirensis]|nr:hypothetical protein [Streptomyces thinghirensis]